MRRCPGCGAFYDGDTCPNLETINHDRVLPPLPPPPPPPSIAGTIVRYEWPGGGMVTAMITDDVDEDGKVGLQVLNPHVRAPLDDVEEIPRGEPTP